MATYTYKLKNVDCVDVSKPMTKVYMAEKCKKCKEDNMSIMLNLDKEEK